MPKPRKATCTEAQHRIPTNAHLALLHAQSSFGNPSIYLEATLTLVCFSSPVPGLFGTSAWLARQLLRRQLLGRADRGASSGGTSRESAAAVGSRSNG